MSITFSNEEIVGGHDRISKVKNLRNVPGDMAKFQSLKFEKRAGVNVLDKHMIICRNDQIAFDNRFPGELRQTNAKNAILPIALSGLTAASGTWTKPTVERSYCGQCILAPTRYQSDMLRLIVTKGLEPEEETVSLCIVIFLSLPPRIGSG